MKDASGVVGWRLVFDNQSSHSRFASATVAYGPAPKAFGKVNGNPSPFLEDVVIAKAPRMTLSRAVTLLRRARYSMPFFNVTLRNPLGPKASKPLYIFGFANGEVRGGQHRDEQGCTVRVALERYPLRGARSRGAS